LNGPLYGTTDRGGANDRGTVYSIKRFGIETVLQIPPRQFSGRTIPKFDE
jgi:uncharacterized repeat protein (TIGR03803 family)